MSPRPHRHVDRAIAALALPTMAALATEPLYDIADTAILGQLGTDELAGAALSMRILAFGYALFIFLMFGTTAAVARSLGSGDNAGAARTAVGAVWIGVGVGIVAALTLGAAGPRLIWLFGGRGIVAVHAETYFRISVLGFPGFLVTMAGIGTLRGRHDTRSPLAIAAVGVTLNLLIESVAIFVWGFGVGASALATVVAKTVTALIYVGLVTRFARAVGVGWRPDSAPVMELGRVGGDLVVRTGALLATLGASTAMAARAGPVILASHSITLAIWQFSTYVNDGVEVAGQALIAERVGSGDSAGRRLVIRRTLLWAIRVGTVAAIAIGVFRTPIVGIFTDDPAVRTATLGVIWFVVCLQPVNSVAFAIDGIMVGAGRQRLMAAAMVAAAGVFATSAWVLSRDGVELSTIWWSIGAFMVARLGLGGAYVRSV